MELFAITLLILGIATALIARRHLREAKLIRLREITHQERMAAMKQETPLPPIDDARLESALLRGVPTGAVPSNGAGVQWVRMVALVLGLAGVFGGIGAAIGLYVIPDPEASDLWSLGLIPIFTGIGLLLFVRLSRGFADKLNT